LAEVLASPLSALFERSYDEGVLPNEWLVANVVPLHKKGPTSDVANFRPISLTSKPCKVMEQILLEHMTAHVTRYALLCPSQFGFTKGRSCTSQLLRYVDYVSDALNDGDIVDSVYFDFKKAFDSVAHDRLAENLAVWFPRKNSCMAQGILIRAHSTSCFPRCPLIARPRCQWGAIGLSDGTLLVPSFC
jgi:hypothetical protein